jgi:hypothetical protein
MTILSKNVILKAACHEVIHQYDPSCSKASLLAFYWSFKEAFGIYATLYTVS